MGNTPSTLRLRRPQVDPPPAQDLLYTKPSGLYPTCPWPQNTVRRQIQRRQLAPRYPGLDHASTTAREECPICMLVYPVLNQTTCCSARLCTECYLQIRPPRANKHPCPFCKHRRLDAVYVGPRAEQDLDREACDARRAADAMRREVAQQRGVEDGDCTGVEVGTAPCEGDHQAVYCLPEVGSLDPLLLEAMASEVTYVSPAGSAVERASASSSGRLELQLGGDVLFEAGEGGACFCSGECCCGLDGHPDLVLREAIRRSLVDM